VAGSGTRCFACWIRTANGDVIRTQVGPLKLDGKHPPERFLSYAFFNILKHYRRSDLARYIALQDGANKVFVDIGANLELYSFIARLHGYATHLVEPEPVHVSFLTRNSGTLGRVISVALADKPGELPLYYEEKNTGATSLVPTAGYRQGAGVVPVRTFSDLAREGVFSNPQAISLIKVDVEAAETATISGMRDFLLCGCRPAIWCEVRGDRSGRAPGTYRDVMSILEPIGYQVCEFVGGVRKNVDKAALAEREVFDLLFEPAAATFATQKL
jgi:FkbM family methyltransferase